MARIRYLKPDFFKDEDLVEHPYWIRLLYQGLWTIADKEGRLEDRPKRIKVDTFPYDNVDIDKGLSELAKIKNHSTRPFIQRYEVNGEGYIAIVNWHKHQKPHHTEKDSIIPEPPPLNTIKINLKGMEKQDEASPALNNGEITVIKPNYLEIAEVVYNHYAKTIKAGASHDAVNNIAKLLKGGFTQDDLIGRINAYSADLHKSSTETKFRLQANNFFGEKARFKDYEPKKEVKYKDADPDCTLCHGQGKKLVEATGEVKICECRLIQ